MTSTAKSFISAGAIVIAAAAVLAGTSMRDKIDLHQRHASALGFGERNLLASRSDQTVDISPGDFYDQLTALLKREYVDPITSDQKLSTGAIRGMVLSLDSPDSVFMDKDEFSAFQDARNGHYHGIGVELILEMLPASPKTPAGAPNSKAPADEPGAGAPELSPEDSTGGRIPALVIAAVVPGGPADKAGLKVGDRIDSIDGHWVLDPYTLKNFSDVQKAVSLGTEPMQKLVDLRRDLRQKLRTSIMPNKAKDRLLLGNDGSMKIGVVRAGTPVVSTVTKAITPEDAVSKTASGAIALHFQTGAASKLRSALGNGPVTLDLRNNFAGDMDEMRQCLSMFAPAGTYGSISNLKNKPAKPLAISDGSKPRSVTLLVDSSTGGVAEVFALALSRAGYAKLVGGAMSPDRNIVEVVKLPDGSGYTLVTGKYEAKGGAA